jgi:kynurenine formamidase
MPRFIDLTLTLREGMRGVSYDCAKELERDGWNARNLNLYSHAGTHMDAPSHFGIEGPSIDEYTIDELSGPAWIIDIPNCAEKYLIGIDALGSNANRIGSDQILLFRTGWSKFVEDPTIYRDALPRISQELADWCVAHKIKMVGVEPPSVADVNNRLELQAVHRTLLKNNIRIVEGLTNLDQIQKERVTFFSLPLKIHEGDGAPCRAFAIEE